MSEGRELVRPITLIMPYKGAIITIMDDQGQLAKDFAHLARLSMSGRQEDVQMFVRRSVRRYRNTLPEVAEQLLKLLQDSPSRASPIRGGEVAAIPVDQDSRLQLLRYEYPVELGVRPVWPDQVKEALAQFCAEKQQEAALLQAGISPSRSMLFVGPPGVGKTLAGRWMAAELDKPLLTLDLSAVMSSFLGRTGINVRYVLDYAKGIDCVLLLDELDAIAKRRDDATEIGELKRLVTVILQEIDGWPESGILIAATNHPDLLDPAAWRRFDLVVHFPMPTHDQRVELIRDLLSSDFQELGVYAEALALLFDGRSFHDVCAQVMRAWRQSVAMKRALGEVLCDLIAEQTSSLPREMRRDVAVRLHRLGYSQRRVSQITGVSRDTIRTALVKDDG